MSKCYVKKPCEHCPYRVDVKPYLHPDRGEELAYITENPYNSFFCHKTTVHSDYDSRDMDIVGHSQLCAGFLTLQATGDDSMLPDGFEPSYDMVYADKEEMTYAYTDEEGWEEVREYRGGNEI